MFNVIIERQVAEGLETYYEEAIASVLQLVTGFPGYIAGEAMIDVERPGHYVTITRWVNRDCWLRWDNSPERERFLDTIRPFLLTEETSLQLKNLRERD